MIGGLEKLSLIDYPKKLSVVVFTVGCNFRCHFCHNPMLVKPIEVDKFKNKSQSFGKNEKGRVLIRECDFFAFLDKRKGKLDAVVITGGEPTIHKDLSDFIKKIKKNGFLVKLDSNGTNPEALKRLLKKNLLDYIAMDIKSDFDTYSYVTGVNVDLEKIRESVNIIMNSNTPYEFRTTLLPDFVDKERLKLIGEAIKGSDKWFLQKFVASKELVDSEFKKAKPFSDDEMEDMKKIASKYVHYCDVR
ncbi:anaerobic ribonucleoside-triphosphate reductase activating protein [bacterium]|nr:anaerobic ribonucleoside-triphosphate reductase activating protein [bacterium]